MTGDRPAGGPPRLLEREPQLRSLDAARAAVLAGQGGVLAVTGPAGAGKTALLEVERERTLAAGLDVLLARASELERDFAFGGARQLLGPGILDAERAGDGDALSLPALAAVLGASGGEHPAPDGFAVLDGLTTLLGRRSVRRPVALLIDDAHWLDAPTVRWLDFLRARVGALRVLIVLTIREPVAPVHDAIHELLADPRIHVIGLPSLSESAIGTLLGDRLRRPVEPALVSGCARATAGNAFAVCELIAALDLDAADQTELAAQLTQRVPATIARSIRARLARLDPDAVAVARALAVLGDGAPPHRVAGLARLTGARASDAADRLAAADLIAAARPLAFVHPLVRSAIEDDLAPGLRAQMHADAARRLAGEDADPEAVAAHLLRADSAADPATVAWLRDAGAVALRRGAPDAAVVYLRRAHEEPPPAAERVEVLHALGSAELLARAPGARAHLQEALARATDPSRRARIGVDLFDALTSAAEWRDARTLLTRLDAELGDRDPGLTVALELRWALGALEQDGGPAELERMQELAAGPPARPLLLALGLILAIRGQRCAEVPGLIEAGLDDGRFLAEHGADSMLAVQGIDALVFVDALPAAHALAEAVCEDARRRGVVLGRVAGAAHRGLVALRAGRLEAAEADLSQALATAQDHQLVFTLPFIAAYLAEMWDARGRLDLAAAALAEVPDGSWKVTGPATITFLSARGAVRRARGEREGAIADLRACGASAEIMGVRNPLFCPWRSQLALALGGGEEASTLAAHELAHARAAGPGRGVAVALRAQAALASGCDAVGLLEQALTALEDSPARLERALVLAELGGALRRSGELIRARSRLREAQDLATRCGAAGLAEQTLAELRLSGARPRRPWVTGVAALTAGELRVAQLAARGLSNAQIAAELMISVKTVKHHLSAAFRKLDIDGRRGLDPEALTAASNEEPARSALR